MTFELRSRTVRIGGPNLAPGCGFRDIVVHEMTESEIRFLKESRYYALIVGLVIGFAAGMALVFWQWNQATAH